MRRTYGRNIPGNSGRIAFLAANVREAIAGGRGDYVPIFLSEIPNLFKSGKLPIDVALIQTSPPDRNGNLSLGISVDIVKSAVENSLTVIAEVNEKMPRTMGDSFIPDGYGGQDYYE